VCSSSSVVSANNGTENVTITGKLKITNFPNYIDFDKSASVEHGFVQLGASGLVPASMFPSNLAYPVSYAGMWDAKNNIPKLYRVHQGYPGDFYIVSVGGFTSLGSGASYWLPNDALIYQSVSAGWKRLSEMVNDGMQQNNRHSAYRRVYKETPHLVPCCTSMRYNLTIDPAHLVEGAILKLGMATFPQSASGLPWANNTSGASYNNSVNPSWHFAMPSSADLVAVNPRAVTNDTITVHLHISSPANGAVFLSSESVGRNG
jgi:hypothetical protein